MEAILGITRKFYSLFHDTPSYVLALNFGGTQLKMALFVRNKDEWRLVRVGREVVSKPFDAARAGEAIRRFAPSFRGLGIVASWKTDFMEKPVVLPDVPEAEIRAAVKFAMEHHFSLQLDHCLYDWAPSVEIMPAHGVKATQYFVYAVTQKEARPYVDLISSLGGLPLLITPTSAACSKLLAREGKSDRDIGILDIDMDSSTFQIFRKGRPLLSRSIGVGSKSFAEAAGAQNKDKSSEGSASPSGAAVGIDQDPFEAAGMPEETIRQLRPQIERLHAGMQSSIDFYHQQNFGGDLGKIYLCESGVKLRDLDKFLEYGTEVSVVRPSPDDLKFLKIDSNAKEELRADLNDFVPVIGSFLVWLENGINLMPREILFNAQTKAKSRVLRLGSIALGCVLGLVAGYMGLSLGLQQQRLSNIRAEEKSASQFETIYRQSEESRKFRAEISKGELSVLALMKLLSAEIPTDCVLTEVGFDRGAKQFYLLGKVLAKSNNAVGTSAQIVTAISKSPFFTKAELVEGLRDPTTGEYRFKIMAVPYDR